MRLRLILWAASVLALAGCGRGGDVVVTAPGAFDTKTTMAELMEHMIQPAAETYWSGWGADVDEAGVHEHAPVTDAEWERLVDGAVALVEAGNSLQLPGRPRPPEAEWIRYSQEMTAVAQSARAAAEAHDKQAMTEQGNRLYFACVACHQTYAPEAFAPSEAPAEVKRRP